MEIVRFSYASITWIRSKGIISEIPKESHPNKIKNKRLHRCSLEDSPGQTRTADLVVNSHPLYRLSYRGMLKCILIK